MKVQEEYKKINRDWLSLHYMISIGVVLFVLAVECAMSLIIINTNLINTTMDRYVLKFILLPSSLNFLCVAIETVVLRAKRFTQNQKIYTVSLIFVVICFIVFSAHSTIIATYYIFIGAVMLTTIYANYRVTSITALMCMIAIVFSEFFVKWDADKISIFESVTQLIDFLVSLIILVIFSMISLLIIRFEQKRNEVSIQKELEKYELKQSLHVDAATGIFNRRAMGEAMKELEDNKSGDTYILAFADMDNFKGVNDNWGHQTGDICLKEFARILKENAANYTPYRYGGDEFCLLFQNVSMEKAVAACEQIQLKLQGLRIKEQSHIRLTASFGLAANTNQVDIVRLIAYSDYALYKAKEARNTIHVYKDVSQ